MANARARRGAADRGAGRAAGRLVRARSGRVGAQGWCRRAVRPGDRACRRRSRRARRDLRGGAMRVLMTTDAVGGVWIYTADLAAALDRHGVDVVVAGMGPRPRRGDLSVPVRWGDF